MVLYYSHKLFQLGVYLFIGNRNLIVECRVGQWFRHSAYGTDLEQGNPGSRPWQLALSWLEAINNTDLTGIYDNCVKIFRGIGSHSGFLWFIFLIPVQINLMNTDAGSYAYQILY